MVKFQPISIQYVLDYDIKHQATSKKRAFPGLSSN